MEKLKQFKRYSKRVCRMALPKKEEIADLVTNFKEEKFPFTWRIENAHLCKLKCGEFLESPSFSTRSFSEDKWKLKFYPRGRHLEFKKITCAEHRGRVKRCEMAGLYISKISSTNAITSFFKCQFSYIRESLSYKLYVDPKEEEVTPEIEMDFTKSLDYGTDNFFCAEYLQIPQTLIVRCFIYVTRAHNRGGPGNDILGFSKSDSLLHDLKAMYDNRKFSDIVLQSGDVKFHAHKAILASRSEVFDAMLQHDMKETKTNVVQIEDIEPSILNCLLQYIYTGSVDDFNIETAVSLYPVANKYLLEELKKWCINVMLANMKVEHVCQIVVLVDLYPDPVLKEATFGMFRNYTSEIFKREEWKLLTRDTDRHALVSDILQAVSADFTTNCSNV